MAEKTAPKIEGGCLCGAVRYSRGTEPAMTLVCHCVRCQKQSGTSFSVIVAVPRESLDHTSWLKPATHIWTGHWQPWVTILYGATTTGRNPPSSWQPRRSPWRRTGRDQARSRPSALTSARAASRSRVASELLTSRR